MRRARGSSLLEVMTAGAVLILGLVGVLQLIIYSASNGRRAGQWVTASYQAQDVLYEFVGNGLDGGGLIAGTYDAGMLVEGGRQIRRTVIITNVASETPTNYPSMQVRAELRWRMGGPTSAEQVMAAEALVSASPSNTP